MFNAGGPLRGRYDLGTWAHPGGPHAPPDIHDTRVHVENMHRLLSWRMSFWLNEIRFQAGCTQAELAARIETTQPAFSKWENGHNLISLDVLGRLGVCSQIPIALYAELPSNRQYSLIWL